MWLIGLYYGALLNLHVTRRYLVYLVPGQCSESVGSKGSGRGLPARPGPHPFASRRISLEPGTWLRLGTVCQALGAKAKGSPRPPPPDPGISSCVPSIASHLLVPTGPGCCLQPHATMAQAEMLRAIPAAQDTSATPSSCVPAPVPRPPVPLSTASPDHLTAQAPSHRDYPEVATAFSLG